MPASHKAISMLIEIQKRDLSNSHAGTKFTIKNITTVEAGHVVEDWRSWAVTAATRRDDDVGHDETEDACHNR